VATAGRAATETRATTPQMHMGPDDLTSHPLSLPQTSELIRTRAERLAQDERAKKRRLELAEQRSDLNPPEVRIRLWEKVHDLRLPSDPMHPILDVIAVSTRLRLVEVQEVQRMRAVQRRAAKVSAAAVSEESAGEASAPPNPPSGN
jgi:hypothetical protein